MTESDEARIQRASQGDARAAEELLERHLPELRRYVRRRVSPALLAHESTSDLVQSVCREVLQDRESFRFQGEAAFRAWLCQAALRKILDRQRFHAAEKRDRAREQEPLGEFSRDEVARLAASISSPSADAMRNEELERLERALGELSEADRRLVRLVHLEGLSHAQAAERLGITEVNSRKQLSRALARLSRLL